MNEIETTLIGMLVAGEHPVLAILREQLAVAEVADRELSGVGFFTHFRVPDAAPRVEQGRLAIGDVYAEVAGLEHAAGFLLFVTNGALDMLEGFIVDGRWPAEPQLVRAYYVRREACGGSLVETEVRDLEMALS